VHGAVKVNYLMLERCLKERAGKLTFFKKNELLITMVIVILILKL